MRILWILLLCLLLPGLALSQGTIDLEWSRPTTNTDGSDLVDLEGYRLYIGFGPIPDDKGNAQLAIEVTAEMTTTSVDFTVPPLGAIVYFRILAYDTSGNESLLSNQISIDFLPPQGGDDLLLRVLKAVSQALQKVLGEEERGRKVLTN